MRAFHLIPAFLFLTYISFSCSSQKTEIQELNTDWQFKHADSTQWHTAEVPGTVHENLYRLGFIEDPLFGDNEVHLQWIGESDWEFKTSFRGKMLMDPDHVELVFEGLDTYADVYLNDSLILRADNMFRSWIVDVKGILRSGDNHLYIRFFGPDRIEKDKEAAAGYRLPEVRGFTRKAPYQYGWDWGPTFVTSGLWKKAYLRTWEEFRIENMHARLEELSDDKAEYSAFLELWSDHEDEIEVSWKIEDEFSITEKFKLLKGLNQLPLKFTIEDPILWWPNGLGSQHLYELDVNLNLGSGIKNIKTRIGVRQIELILEPDSIGETFYFLVNGHPVFMKGANYIPQDNFLPRVPDDKYRETLQSAVDANMNMLRVWGGGVYERDIFYDLCDEMGLLVWQDFMFACNMYPGDEAFLENVRQEASEQVKRLRNHPCLALWCGNNEISEGWVNWGWQKSLNYSTSDSIEVWHSYLNIFEDILPTVVDEFDHGRPYWPSSPSTGWGHEQALYSGDMHYWGVWWGAEPFEVYEEKVGRFMSEYGFQAFPDLKSLDSCLHKEDFVLSSENLLNHQKHPRGMELIQLYMERDFPVPDQFAEYAYVSQLVQGYGIKMALDAHRRAMPYCMGTLYWQLNDCWPVVSWSSVDYYNRWKALHYFTRTAFEKVLVSFEENEGKLDVYLVSDYLNVNPGQLNLRLMDFNGNLIWHDTQDISLEGNTSIIYYSLNSESLLSQVDKSEIFLNVVVGINDSVQASGNYYFLPFKDLSLPSAEVAVFPDFNVEKGISIAVTSPVLAKNVFLGAKVDGHFTENYFDLLPGDTVLLKFDGGMGKLMTNKNEQVKFLDELTIRCLNDLF